MACIGNTDSSLKIQVPATVDILDPATLCKVGHNVVSFGCARHCRTPMPRQNTEVVAGYDMRQESRGAPHLT